MSDGDEFAAIYRRTYRRTLTYALRRARTPDDAHDVVSETYLVAWRHLEDLCQASEPQAWLYGVAYKVLTNQRRGNTRRVELIQKAESQATLPGFEVDPAWLAEKRDEVARVAAAMATLSNRDQEILRLVAFEELDHDEIAGALGIRKPLVRSIIYRARRRLDKALAEEEMRSEVESGHNRSEQRQDRFPGRSYDE